MPAALKLEGRRFGKRIVLSRAPSRRHNGSLKTYWVTKCDCGTIDEVLGGNLTRGSANQCSVCLYAQTGQNKLTHRHSRRKLFSPTYRSWAAMIQRCINKKIKCYKDYGGRGITVCDRWRKSFETFLADMGERPKGLSIDRINNDGNYEPGNCKWATYQEQMKNRRKHATLENFTDEEIASEFYKRQNRPNQGTVLEAAPVIRLFEQ